jgi:hypothetical protein
MVCHLVRPDLAGDPRICGDGGRGGGHRLCHGLVNLRSEKIGEGTIDMWFRSTWCLGRIDGRWRITHEHNSTPFYMDGTYRAATDLVP